LDAVSLPALFSLLLLLIVLSAFFSGSETGLMTLNRYRLLHLARHGSSGAKIAARLLQRPDRLIGLILLGNVAANTLAASVATLIGLRLAGDRGVVIATAALTFVLLIFGEATPKTLAALYPERIAFPSAHVYDWLRWPARPLVWLVSRISTGLLRLLRVDPAGVGNDLSSEELRSVVAEAGALIPQRHQRMLLSILDLERATVEDIMVPRNEIFGLDLEEPWPQLQTAIVDSQYTRVPLYEGSIDQLCGIIHLRRLLQPMSGGELDAGRLRQLAREPYFIPEGTPLNRQLLQFQEQRRRIGFVVDEYGDIQGLVTLEDILEEVVGDFTSDPATRSRHFRLQNDGSVLARGSTSLRHLNRGLGWTLPTHGPKTLNGLILEQLEELPEPGKRLRIGDYLCEIVETRPNAVTSVRLSKSPRDSRELTHDDG
jgi:Putative Mg2+ and Co2+ transporter CorB